MKKIILDDIVKKAQTVFFRFSVSENLEVFFSGKEFAIEYSEDVANIPDAVLAIPFVCNVLPTIWLEDAELIIPELDEDFYKSIPEFKKGYINMYPDAEFMGKITVGKVVNCRRENQHGVVAFFSGGLDATTTLLRHLDEKPDLISIWGSDITYDNAAGWKPIQKAIDEAAQEYGVKHINIHSSFRQFDKERELERVHCDKLHDNLWHGVKCSIGLIGHAAPYVWLHGKSTVYIASTYSVSDGNVTSASYPTIDNYVRFCGANVVHDGFEMNRQDKTRFVAEYHRTNPKHKIQLHVCWESSDGGNCCHCEKCYRTLAGLWVEGEEPKDYGMNYPDEVMDQMYRKMALDYPFSDIVSLLWQPIQDRMKENHSVLSQKRYYSDIRWIETFDFFHPQKNWCRRKKHWNQKIMRIKNAKGLRGKLGELDFYQKLSKIKKRMLSGEQID